MRFVDLVADAASSRGNGAPSQELAAAERVLGRFPDDLREYLSELGWATVDGFALLGLGEGVPRGDNLVETWLQEGMPNVSRPLPRDLAPLIRDGAGGYYGVKTGFTSSPVLYWAHDGDGLDPEVVGDSLKSWFLDALGTNAVTRSSQATRQGAGSLDIATAEELLGVTFPVEYAAFLQAHGWLSLGPVGIWGVGSSVPPLFDVVRQNLTLRGRPKANLPNGAIAVMSDVRGGLYFILGQGDDQSVYFTDGSATQVRELEVVSDSFTKWWLDMEYASRNAER